MPVAPPITKLHTTSSLFCGFDARDRQNHAVIVPATSIRIFSVIHAHNHYSLSSGQFVLQSLQLNWRTVLTVTTSQEKVLSCGLRLPSVLCSCVDVL